MAAGAQRCISSSSQEAQRFFRRADKPTARKLARCFQSLERDPRVGNNIKPLMGRFSGAFRYRVGDLRVIYSINNAALTIFVITIANRKDVYE